MLSTLATLLALIEIAKELERELGEAWPSFRDDLLDLSGRLERDGDSRALALQVDLLIDRLLKAASPRGQDAVRRALRQASGNIEAEGRRTRGGHGVGAGAQRAEAESLPDGVVTVPVYYGTDRDRSDAGSPNDFYGGRHGSEVSYGIAQVTVPTRERLVGDLTSPKWWKLQFRPDTAKHVILTAITPLDREAFVRSLRDGGVLADTADILLFIHGFNVPFTEAARRAAQIAVDLQFKGRTLLYSWASAGDPKQYTVDADTIGWSTRRFRAFLVLALTEAAAPTVHVIAHSMGNRALMQALEDLAIDALPPGAATLGQVVFAAPDVSRDAFQDLALAFRGRAERFTLYASAADIALKASKLVNGYARAGEAGDGLVVVDGVDTIDATRADTSLLSLKHSYFGDARSILLDIRDMIENRTEPARRGELREASGPPHRYWEYRE